MPTPVSAARPCLSGDAAAALDEAVAAARRRSHAQTTSLHVVFALLSSSAPTHPLLRDAVSRARSSAYSPRLQFKALELCFGVALDRLPSSSHHHHHPPHPPPNEPPVSNSLMAAVKRSQAHQRRNPDTFHLYAQHHAAAAAAASSFSGVKVELQQLVLAILDDPVVSRVFGEAGFRSCDIKIAVLRPPLPPILRFPRCPPLFLSSFAGDDLHFPFPFPADENCRRIGEILARPAGRNPVLVGAGAAEAALDFSRAIEGRNWSALPQEIHGVRIVSLDSDAPASALEELRRGVEEPGALASIGDLKGLLDEPAGGFVSELTRVLEACGGRLWVMAWSATYETYMKFLSRHQTLHKDWDLQLLPITSPRAPATGLITRPHSLMESFVPFGGFFPAAYESKSPLTKLYQPAVRCQHCNEKYEQEVAGVLKECSTSIDDQHQENMPAWMRRANMFSTSDGMNSTRATDDRSLSSARLVDLQKKWNDNCQRLHHGSQILGKDNYPRLPQVARIPNVPGKERTDNPISKNADAAQNHSGHRDEFSAAIDLQQVTRASKSFSLPLDSEPKNKDLISKLQVRLSRSEQLQTKCFGSQQDSLSELGISDDHASPTSATSVTTDLILGTHHELPCKDEKPLLRIHTESLDDLSGSLSLEKVNEFSGSVADLPVRSFPYSTCPTPLSRDRYLSAHARSGLKVPSCISPNNFDNYKIFCTSLVEKVGRQEEAMRAISETIIRCKTGNERHRGTSVRGDIWLSFLGSDRIGKKRTAVALAELIYGSRDSLICIDVDYQDDFSRSNTICAQQDISDHDSRFTGKPIVDVIAEAVGKNPWSIIFLENIDKADLLVQNSLIHAIQTGKISDSRGREFGINNTIFLVSAKTIPDEAHIPGKECINFSEERILGAQRGQMKISVASVQEGSRNVNLSIISKQPLCSVSVSKRKLNSSNDYNEQLGRAQKRSNALLDLNLPVEEVGDADSSSGEEDILESSEPWVEEFLNLVDGNVNFKPFDFDGLADYILNEISKTSRKAIVCECMLEIDVKVMEQILAATWLENTGNLNNWLEKVLTRSLIELGHKYNLSKHTNLSLGACEGAPVFPAPGILLPSRIIVE